MIYCMFLYHNVTHLANNFSACLGWHCTKLCSKSLFKTIQDTVAMKTYLQEFPPQNSWHLWYFYYFPYWIFGIEWCFPFHGETHRGNGSRTSTRQGRGNTTGLHGVKQRGNTTGSQTGGNNEKMRNVTFIVGKQEKAACATHWNFKIVHMCSIIVRYFQNGFLSIN